MNESNTTTARMSTKRRGTTLSDREMLEKMPELMDISTLTRKQRIFLLEHNRRSSLIFSKGPLLDAYRKALWELNQSPEPLSYTQLNAKASLEARIRKIEEDAEKALNDLYEFCEQNAEVRDSLLPTARELVRVHYVEYYRSKVRERYLQTYGEPWPGDTAPPPPPPSTPESAPKPSNDSLLSLSSTATTNATTEKPHIVKAILSAILALIAFGAVYFLAFLILGGIIYLLSQVPVVNLLVDLIFYLRGDSPTMMLTILSTITAYIATKTFLAKFSRTRSTERLAGILSGSLIVIIHVISFLLNLVYGESVFPNIIQAIAGILMVCSAKD